MSSGFPWAGVGEVTMSAVSVDHVLVPGCRALCVIWAPCVGLGPGTDLLPRQGAQPLVKFGLVPFRGQHIGGSGGMAVPGMIGLGMHRINSDYHAVKVRGLFQRRLEISDLIRLQWHEHEHEHEHGPGSLVDAGPSLSAW